MNLREWHTHTPDELETIMQSNLDRGLTEWEAQHRLAKHGPNELPEAPPVSALTLLLGQFTSVIVWVLIGAAVISGLLQEWVDAAAILAIVLLNAVLGFVQEYRAEQSIAALKKLSITMARVFREEAIRSIPASELVPGDLIQVEAGDRVPADSRVVYATGLQTQEASLTGESTPVAKSAEPIPQAEVPCGRGRCAQETYQPRMRRSTTIAPPVTHP
ncbi:MAG: HAD-IC family P-type ATPase [Nitrospiraceae bacterium]